MRMLILVATLYVALFATDFTAAMQATGGVDLVTIDVRDKDLREVLSQIGDQVKVNIVVDPQVTDELGDLFGRRQLPRHLVNHRSPTTFQVIGIDRARDVALQVKRTRAPIQRIADIEYPYVVIARVLLDPTHVNERCC